MQSQRGEEKRIPINEIAQTLEGAVAAADPLRAQGLEKLQRIRNIKAKSLAREQARLSQKLGPTHPRVLETLQKIQVNQELNRNLVREIERINVNIPQADENTWILHGHVLNSKLKGVPNLTVAIYDQWGNWIEKLGYGCTDKNGYFLISYKDNQEKARINQEVKVFVRVFNQKSQLLHADKRPISPKLGQVDYIRIILGEDAGSCSPPPSSAREVTEEITPPETENPG